MVSSLRKQIPLLVTGGVALIVMTLLLLFYFQVNSATLAAGADKAKADLDVTEALIDLKYPGPWSVNQGELYKGGTNITNYFVLSDYIKELTGNECVIFLRNVCVSTTVPEGECNRAIGVYAPYEVTSKVLEVGPKYYTGRAELAGNTYHTAYKPIKNEYGEIIGVLYVGVPATFYQNVVYGPTKTVGLTGLAIILLIGLIAWVSVARSLGEPLQKVIGRLRQVALAGPGKPDGLPVPNEAPQPAEEKIGGPPKQGMMPSGSKESENQWLDVLLDLPQELPKGLSHITLRQIVLFLKHQEGNDVTIQDISDAVTISKVTVRHYLDYLSENELVDVEQKYGSVGRPLRIYKLK